MREHATIQVIEHHKRPAGLPACAPRLVQIIETPLGSRSVHLDLWRLYAGHEDCYVLRLAISDIDIPITRERAAVHLAEIRGFRARNANV